MGFNASKLSIWCGGGSDSYKYAWWLWHVYGDMDSDKNGLNLVFCIYTNGMRD
jgi:hypothetical protein